VLREFTRKHEADSSLDLSATESRLLVVRRELSSLTGDALENIVDEGVHDGHSLLGDTGVGVHLLQHLVNVRGVRLSALLVSFSAYLLRSSRGLSRLLGGCLSHGCDEIVELQVPKSPFSTCRQNELWCAHEMRLWLLLRVSLFGGRS
jgi:hypothetical protein